MIHDIRNLLLINNFKEESGKKTIFEPNENTPKDLYTYYSRDHHLLRMNQHNELFYLDTNAQKFVPIHYLSELDEFGLILQI